MMNLQPVQWKQDFAVLALNSSASKKNEGWLSAALFLSFSFAKSTMAALDYFSAVARKRPWQAVPVTKGQLVSGAEETIFRALAIRHLELPVKDMLLDGLKRELPSTPGLIESIESNILDEEQAEAEAFKIRQAWIDHPAHPIAKVAVLERSLFFTILPFFRFNGDKGLRTVASDISRDEICHAFCHTKICKEAGEKYGESLNKLRKMTALWIYDKLGKSSNKYLDKDFWLRQSDNLFLHGKAPELNDTKASVMLSFFETNALNLPAYGR